MNIWNSSFFGKLCVGMEPAHFVASSKGINLLKDSNNYLYFHQKDLGKRMQSCSCSTKGIQRTGFDCNATYLGSHKFIIAT